MDFEKGAVSHLTILHDDWCAIFDGGYCDCNVEIMWQPVEVTA